MCCKLGKNTDYRPRHFRARQKSSDMRRMSVSSDASSAFDGGNNKKEDNLSDSDDGGGGSNNNKESVGGVPAVKKRRSGDGGESKTIVNSTKSGLMHEVTGASTKPLRKPVCVVRPATPQVITAPQNNYALDKRCILPVFKYLTQQDLYRCMQVCKLWAQYSIDPSLWRKITFINKHITSSMLIGTVRRQPEHLILDWSTLNKFHIPYLLPRIPNLKKLSLVSTNIKSVLSFRSCQCSSLTHLDLSYITELNDGALRDILGPNNDSRRGITDDSVRFRNLRTLNLSGTSITDIAMRYITQFLPNIQHLSLSMCARITDAGIAQLSTKPANTVYTLVSLDLRGTKLVTEVALEHLAKCQSLVRLDCRHVSQISTQALIKFAAKSERDLQLRDIKLVDLRASSSSSSNGGGKT